MARSRNEKNYRNTKSKDGTLSPHISKKTAERIIRYCKANNLNKTKYIEECCNRCLDSDERNMYDLFSKEQLIDMLLHRGET